MAYCFFIPFVWYILLLFIEKKQKLLITLVLLIINSILFFIHPYLGFISIFFIFAYWCVYLFFNKKELHSFKNFSYIIIQVFIPILIFQLFIILNDTHIDRTSSPWGFFLFNASFSTVFLANHPPINPLIHKLYAFFSPESTFKQTWEGLAYIGIVSNIVLIITITILSKRYIKRKKKKFENIIPNVTMRYFLIAGILILLYSMTIPFRYAKWTLDYIPGLSQFRVLGRFAWAFFYIATIYSIFMIDVFFKKAKNKKIGIGLMCLTIVVFFIEGKPYHDNRVLSLTQTNNLFLEKNLDDNFSVLLENISATDYQAIIPLPFYSIGSEDYGIIGTPKSHKFSQILSFHTGLPMFGACLSRTSAVEAKNTMQLLSLDYYDKVIKEDIKSNKDFLVFYTKEQLTSSEQQLLNKAKLIDENNNFALYEINFDTFFKSSAQEELNKFLDKKDTLFVTNGFYSTDTNAFFIYENFDDLQSTEVYTGSGAYSGIINNYNRIKNIPANTLNPDKEYSISFWYNNNAIARTNAQAVLEEVDTVTGQANWVCFQSLANCRNIDGDWSMLEVTVVAQSSNSEFKLFINKKDDSADKIYVDDLLIRPVDVDIYSIDETNKILFKNNHRIKY